MLFRKSIKRAAAVALAGGIMTAMVSPPAYAETSQTIGTLAASPADPCDRNGTTSSDAAIADQLNGVLTADLDNYMNAYRVSCARAIIKKVRERGMSHRAAIIAITTSIVETGLRNINVEVDHDSLGLFQQRASWGSAADRLDPAWATNEFLKKMIREYPDDSWKTAPVGEVCQKVQVSALPDKYAVQVGDATKIVDAVWDRALGRPFDSFSGDARADLVVHTGTDVGIRTGVSAGGFDAGTVPTTGWGRYHGMQVTNGLGQLFFADYNADHKTDMIVHDGTNISVRLNNGNGGFNSGTTVSSGWGRYHGLDVANGLGQLYFADYNADGFADMIVHDGTDISVRLNNKGAGFNSGTTVSSGWGRYHGMQITNGLGRLYFADYDGDGYDDMIVHDGTNVSVRLNNDGAGFDSGRNVTSGYGRYHGLQVPNGLGRLYFS
jgi:hypothetical protein